MAAVDGGIFSFLNVLDAGIVAIVVVLLLSGGYTGVSTRGCDLVILFSQMVPGFAGLFVVGVLLLDELFDAVLVQRKLLELVDSEDVVSDMGRGLLNVLELVGLHVVLNGEWLG